MAYIKGHSIHPILKQWAEDRTAVTGRAFTANKAAQRVSTMAHSLGVPPEQLPKDAVSRHFMGRDAGTPMTCHNYDVALRQWHRWLRDNGTVGARPTRVRATDELHPDIEAWALRLETRVSRRTVNSYVRDVTALLKTVGKESPREITETDVLLFLRHVNQSVQAVKGHPMRGSYYNRILCSVRSMAKSLRMEDPCRFLDSARVDKRRHKPIEREDLAHLLACALQERASSNPEVAAIGRRMYTMCKLESSMGLRVGEASQVRPCDLVQVDGQWCIEAEGVAVKGHEHMGSVFLPVTQSVFEDLTTNYQPTERVTPVTWDAKKASANFAGWCRGKGVETTAHRLRAYYATWLYYKSNHDIMLVMRRMRHANISTTAGYIGDLNTPEQKMLISTFDDDLVTVPDTPKNVIPFMPLQAPRIIPSPVSV